MNTPEDDTQSLPAQAESPAFPLDVAEPKPRRRWPWILGAVGVATVGVYGLGYLEYGDAVPDGTTVLGVDIGGLASAEAEQVLVDELPPRVDKAFVVAVSDDAEVEVVPSDAGLSIDEAATVDEAGGGSANPLDLWRTATGNGGEVEPIADVNRDALVAALEAVATQTDRPPVDASVSFSKGKVVVEDAIIGLALDAAGAADAITEVWPTTDAVEVPSTQTEPAVTQAIVDTAVTALATPAMAAPVRVTSDLGSADITPIELSPALSMVPDAEGALELKLDGNKLQVSAEASLDEVGQSVRDARVEIRSGKPVVIPAETGRGPTTEELEKAITPVLPLPANKRSVAVALSTVEPTIASDSDAVTSVREIVSEFTTHFPYAEYRNTNIGRAAELIDNTFLAPDEIFSLNGIVGERTEANGFTSGLIISDGQFREELGGGVSQMATTSFNAGHFAGFEDIEHKPHSLYISRYPAGREATVAWPSLDMAFRNDTPHGAVVQTLFSASTPSSQGSITVRIWSTPYWQVKSVTGPRSNATPASTIYDTSDACRATAPVDGFDITVTRTLSRKDKEVRTEKLFTRYNPTNRVICGERP